jgi:hypothetical protein
MTNDNKEELIDPHKLSLRSQLMTVLQHALRRDTYVGLDTIAIVCETIAADCRFGMWFLSDVKKSATEEQLMELLLEYKKLTDMVSVAVRQFDEDREKESFQPVLKEVAMQLSEMMNNNCFNSLS